MSETREPMRVFGRDPYGLRALRRAALKGYFVTLLPDDAADVVAEVERLRGEVSLLQQEARIGRNISDGLAAEVATERAAVVAFVRGARLDDFAGAIESGEHRREETK